MNPEQIVTFIHTVPIFHELGREQLEDLARAAEVREFPAGGQVVQRDQEASELFIFVEGEYQAFVREEEIELEREVARFFPGDQFGGAMLIARQRYPASVRAVAAGRAIVLSAATIEGLFDKAPSFGRSVCRSMAIYLSRTVDQEVTIPFATLDSFPGLASAAGLLPPRISRFCQSVVVERAGSQLTVAMVDPSDVRARGFISDVLRQYQLQFVAVAEDDFERHAAKVLGPDTGQLAPQTPFDNLSYATPSGDEAAVGPATGEDVLARAITTAIRSGASDIHFEPDDELARIRLRIDGKMVAIQQQLPPPVLRQAASRIKVMADLDTTNIRRPQDGRFMVQADDRRIEFRVSVTPCQGGETVVLRVIAPNPDFQNLRNLILSEPAAMFAEELFSSPSGLVLVTGPAGAGKTTTLYAALNWIVARDQAINVVTIEEPVEYNLRFATQIQVNRELNLDFAQILRTVLRQDPNVILVGEIRDEESADIALEAATTGHLVLSSLHTYSALDTLVRLRDLEVKPYLLASALKGVISQRLVARLCPGCTEPVAADDPLVGRLKAIGVLPAEWSGKLSRGRDGEGCPPGGESGRVGVFEILAITPELRDLIERSEPTVELETKLTPANFFSLARYSRYLLREGLVAPERIEAIFPKTFAIRE